MMTFRKMKSGVRPTFLGGCYEATMITGSGSKKLEILWNKPPKTVAFVKKDMLSVTSGRGGMKNGNTQERRSSTFFQLGGPRGERSETLRFQREKGSFVLLSESQHLGMHEVGL
jgi:hypothetical protein